MTNVILFEYETNELRVIRDENGDPWVVAKDVCVILGLTNPTETLKALDDDEKNTLRVSEGINGQPGNPNVNVISESGLYTLIIRSNKPEARKFRRWVTHDVLPALRRTGGYVMPGGVLPDETRPLLVSARRMERTARIFKAMLSMAKTAGMRGRRAVLRANEVTVREAGCDCLGMMGGDAGPQVAVEGGLSRSSMNDFYDLWRDIGECTVNVAAGGGDVDEVKVRDLVNPDRVGDGDPGLKALEGYGIKVMADGVFLHPTTVLKMLVLDTGWEREDIRDILIRVPGAVPKLLRVDGVHARGIIIPFGELLEGGAS